MAATSVNAILLDMEEEDYNLCHIGYLYNTPVVMAAWLLNLPAPFSLPRGKAE